MRFTAKLSGRSRDHAYTLCVVIPSWKTVDMLDFSFADHASGTISKKFLPNPRSQTLSPCCLLKEKLPFHSFQDSLTHGAVIITALKSLIISVSGSSWSWHLLTVLSQELVTFFRDIVKFEMQNNILNMKSCKLWVLSQILCLIRQPIWGGSDSKSSLLLCSPWFHGHSSSQGFCFTALGPSPLHVQRRASPSLRPVHTHRTLFQLFPL